MNNDPAPDTAKARYFVIQASRWTGSALVLIGLLVLNGKVDLPAIVGYVLTVAGLIDALIVPTLLARRWKTPPQ